MSELLHPGYIEYERGEEYVRVQRSLVTFDQFLPFVREEGIKSETFHAFIRFLESFRGSMPELWEPGNCMLWTPGYRQVRHLTREAQFPAPAELSLEYFGRTLLSSNAHVWGIIETEDLRIIVDPTGLPVRSRDPRGYKGYHPYFGLVDTVESYSGYFYRRGNPVEAIEFTSEIREPIQRRFG